MFDHKSKAEARGSAVDSLRLDFAVAYSISENATES
jgi:hypothetical protein